MVPHIVSPHELVDWAMLAFITCLATGLLYIVPTYCRPFRWDDPAIGYPNLPDTFPTYSLGLMLLFALLFYVVFVLYVEPWLRRRRRRLWRTFTLDTSAAGARTGNYAATPASSSTSPGHGPLYPWLKAQLWATGLQYAVINLMKVTSGRLRPDFLARLAEAGITPSSSKQHDPYTDPAYYCKLTRTNVILANGRLSYPSGHASTSFSVCTMVTLFLLAHTRPLARQGSFTRLLLTLSPLTVAFACAITRTRDYKHNYSDITTGSLIGIMSALLSFTVCFREVHGGMNIYRARCSENARAAPPPTLGGNSPVAMVDADTAAAEHATAVAVNDPVFAHGYGATVSSAERSSNATTATAAMTMALSHNSGASVARTNTTTSDSNLAAAVAATPLVQPSCSLEMLYACDKDSAVVPWV